MQVLRIEHIEVGEARLEARVKVLDPDRMRTSAVPDLAERALSLLPGLARHRCENDTGKRFLVEMLDTEVAHLLEHVTVELMALSGSPRSLHADTAWDFARDGHGVFRVCIAFDDDLAAIAALREAVTIVEWLMTPQSARTPTSDAPEIGQAVRRIEAARATAV